MVQGQEKASQRKLLSSTPEIGSDCNAGSVPNASSGEAVASAVQSSTGLWISTAGLLFLPVLFGMNMVSPVALVRQRTVYVSSGFSSEVKAPGISPEDPAWTYFISALFFGAFSFSAFLFVAGMLRKSPYRFFKQIFALAAFSSLAGNLIIPHMTSPFILVAARFLIGLGSGVTCGLGVMYYMSAHTQNTGKKLSIVQSLLISVGVMLGGRIIDMLRSASKMRIYDATAALSIVPLVVSLVWTENTKEERAEAEANAEAEDRGIWIKVLICLIVHVLQQTTGINPILSEQDLVFSKAEGGASMDTAKVFFDFAGIVGAGLSVMFMSALPEHYHWVVLLSGLGSAASFVPLLFSWDVLKWWGAGFYFMFFSLGLAGLPWILPPLVLRGESCISLAAGLGAMCNWLVSCILLSQYRQLYNVLRSQVFIVFLISSMLVGISGFYFLRSARTAKALQPPRNAFV